jgi:hypothetical protein
MQRKRSQCCRFFVVVLIFLTIMSPIYSADYLSDNNADEVTRVTLMLQGNSLIITLTGHFRADRSDLYNPLIKLNLDNNVATGSKGYDNYLSGHNATALYYWDNSWIRKKSAKIVRLEKTAEKIVLKITNIADLTIPKAGWQSKITVLIMNRNGDNSAWITHIFKDTVISGR